MMPKEFQRTDRVASALQRRLSSLITTTVKDPRVTGLLTINHVRVSNDLGHAKIYVSILNPQGEVTDVIAALNGASGFLQNNLGKSLNLRQVPKLTFFHDTLLQEANRISQLIDEVMADEAVSDHDATDP